MQEATHSYSTQREDSIDFLPIIDLNPSDENCIFSTLLFIIDQANKLNVVTPSVTFDQPLWLKATGIIEEAKLDIVCRLGGFHTLMSFLGSIGGLMKGSGLEELFAEVYADHSVTHMISGKAVSRALRAHFLVEISLTSLLIDILIEEGLIDETAIHPLFADILEVPTKENIESVINSQIFRDISKALSDLKQSLSQKSRTAKLWLLYLEYIDILKKFIIAERTSNWTLHIESTLAMLNLFAATGHINYAKCARFYIQQMQSLPESHPWLYNCFMNGLHAVRRSNRHWSGLWSDLVIEQTLMKSVKSRGGLTRGRGMTDSVRHLWVLSLNYSASVHQSMMILSGLDLKTSEQHVDMGESRRKRDFEDYKKFHDFLETRNPFTFADEHLHSLTNRWISISGQDEVNCDRAEEVGTTIHQVLNGQDLACANIQRKNCLRPLEVLGNIVKIGEEPVYVDPKVLFTRLTAIAERDDDVEKYFSYELTPNPPSLFKDGLMRKADKAALRRVLMNEDDAIRKDQVDRNSLYVVDGGALLHRVRWLKESTFKELAALYVSYVRRHYGSAYIVFDGYVKPTTKSHEHIRRTNGKKCQNVEISEINSAPTTQDRFLSNEHNKVQFIGLISKYLKEDGQYVTNCDGDADTQIVETAINLSSSTSQSIVVVADDTDISVMLLYHWREEFQEIIIFQERAQKGWNLKSISPSLQSVKEHLLFIHAWSGCDTVSAPFGKGKLSFYNLVKKSDELKDISTAMSDVWADQKDIGELAEPIFRIMYGGKRFDTLTKLRLVENGHD